MENPNGLTDEQVKQGYSTIPGNFDPVTGQLKTTITSASLAPQPSPDLSPSFTPQSNLATPVVAEATANQEGFQNDYQRYLDLQNQGQDNSLANMIAGVDLQSLTGRGSAQAQEEERLGVNQFNQDIADLSSQRGSKLAAYNKSIAQQRAEQAQLEAGAGAKGLTTAMLGGQQAALARVREAENQTAAAEIGLLDAQILGTQGKLEAAQNAADRAVDLMYQDREAQVNAKLKQIELYTPIFNAQEKKKADAVTFALNKENERLQTEKENTKSIENMVINASSQSAPQDLVNRARKAKTPGEAAMILGQYAGDFYKTELLKQQIATEKAQKANYDANAEKTRAETNAANAFAKLTTNQKIQANIASGKIQPGQLVSLSTGEIPKNISADKVDGLLALKDLAKKTKEYNDVFTRFEEEALFGGAGLATGLKNVPFPSGTKTALDGLRSEITDLLARARSGAALTAYETAEYEKKLPSSFNSSLGLGKQGTDKIKALQSSLDSTLNTKLQGYGVTFAEGVEDDYLDTVESSLKNLGTQGLNFSGYAASLTQ